VVLGGVWTGEPQAKPWRRPTRPARPRPSSSPPRAGDRAVRLVRGQRAPTLQVDRGFAQTAAREAAGEEPAYHAPPRPTKKRRVFERSRPQPQAEPRAERPRDPWAEAAARKRLEEFLRSLLDAPRERARASFEALGFGPTASAAEMKHAFRQRALRAHLDHGGTAEGFIKLKGHYDAALSAAQGAATPGR